MLATVTLDGGSPDDTFDQFDLQALKEGDISDDEDDDDLLFIADFDENDRKFYTFWSPVCLLFGIFVSGCIRQLLPPSFLALSVSLGLSTTQLGMIPFFRMVSSALGLCVTSYFSDSVSRKKLLLFSFFNLGLFTIASAFVPSFYPFLFCRTCAGFSFEFLPPIAASYVGDMYRRDRRGLVFAQQATMAVVGVVITTMVMGSLSSQEIFGFDGWRVITFFFGLLATGTTILIHFLMYDPVKGRVELEEPSDEAQKTELLFENSKGYKPFNWPLFTSNFFSPAYLILVTTATLHGIGGAAFAFMMLWLQYAGLSDLVASLVFSAGAISYVFGAFFGGFVGDAASRSERFRNTARIMVGQIGIVVGFPFITSLLLFVGGSSNLVLYLVFCCAFAIAIPYSDLATDQPLLTEVIHPECRSSLIGVTHLISTLFSSTGSLIVGTMAASFGYEETSDIDSLPGDVRTQNMNALGYSMLILCGLWLVQVFVYFPLYHYYPLQRDNLHEQLKNEEREEWSEMNEKGVKSDPEEDLT